MKDSKDVCDTIRGDERKSEAVTVLTVEPTAEEKEVVKSSLEHQARGTAQYAPKK
jgi:hypothetical protein